MLQTRNGKRTAKAALRIAVELAHEGLISKEEAVLRVEPLTLDQLLHPTIDPRAHRKVIATGLPASPGAASGEIVFTSDEAAQLKGDGTQGHPGAGGDIAGGHPRHARRRRHPHHPRRHDLARRRRCARHGQALRVRRRAHPRRLQRAHHDRRQPDVQTGRCHHRRRLDRPSAGRQGRYGPAAAFRRIRHADRLGRQGAQARRARQCRHAGGCARGRALWRRRHRAVPHRAHVFRREPHPGGARDDPGRRREVAARGARQAAADAARRLPRTVRDHGRAAGHHPSARSAAARIPAARRGGDRRSRGRHGGRSEEARRPRTRARRVQSDARLPRLPHRDCLSGNRRDAGARHLRGGGRGAEDAPASRSSPK